MKSCCRIKHNAVHAHYGQDETLQWPVPLSIYTWLCEYCAEKNCVNSYYITEKTCTSPCISLFSLHLSLMETTLGSTLTPEMEREQGKTESEDVGGSERRRRRWLICCVWVECERKERETEKSVRERSCVWSSVSGFIGSMEREGKRDQRHRKLCVCVKWKLWCQAWFHYQG